MKTTLRDNCIIVLTLDFAGYKKVMVVFHPDDPANLPGLSNETISIIKTRSIKDYIYYLTV